MHDVVMATSGRKGTFLVLTALQKHPQIFVNGQVFASRPEVRPTYLRGYDNAEVGRRCFDRTALQLPAETAIILPVSPLMGEPNPASAFWLWARRRPALRLLHLRRRNLLRSYLSELVAKQTGEWSTNYPDATTPTVRVDPLEAARVIAEDLAASHQCQIDFCDHASLIVYYEDLVRNTSAQLALIQQFLGVTPREVTPNTRKQASRPLPEAIENYTELVAAWKGTVYEQYLA